MYTHLHFDAGLCSEMCIVTKMLSFFFFSVCKGVSNLKKGFVACFAKSDGYFTKTLMVKKLLFCSVICRAKMVDLCQQGINAP